MDVPGVRDGRRVLVVEDEYLIGNFLAEELEALGFEVGGPFAACAGASAWLASNTPDLAILDVLLKSGDCLPVAQELRRRSVPILFFTGLNDWAPFRDEFAEAHVIRKPAVPKQLASALNRLLGEGPGSPAVAA